MALLSVKRFLTQLEEEAAYRKVISTLLDGVAAHALELDSEACRSFRERIVEIRQGMASETTVEALLVDAGAAVQAIGDYARETNRRMHAQGIEMQNVIAMLAGGSADDGRVGRPAVARLQKIGDGLGRGAAVEDASTFKTRLQEHAGDVRDAAKPQKAEPDQMVQALRQELSYRQEAARNAGLDPVTLLPSELAAQAQFLSALRTGEQKHVAVFVLGSARHINLRFGRAAGDDVVRALKEYLAGHLAPGDRMFRWPGPAIVALLAGTDSFDRVRARLKRFLEKPIERTFDINGRSVLIPLSVAWSVFGLSQPLADVHRQIHDFIASQGYRDEDPVPA
ncbi:MAG: GGDEF domain-containing protein [Bryobacteraceae bacterium]